jgi:transcriptional regulator of arginine metabolism
MPSDRETRDRRRQAIREILLGEEPVHQQWDLVDRLREKGFSATQSNVSRDLSALGAVRIEGRYMIPSWTEDDQRESPLRQVLDLILELKPAGPYQLLMVTREGAGNVVGRALDEDDWEDIVGTLSGYSSVLVLTENAFFQKLVYERLKWLTQGESSVEPSGGRSGEPEGEEAP